MNILSKCSPIKSNCSLPVREKAKLLFHIKLIKLKQPVSQFVRVTGCPNFTTDCRQRLEQIGNSLTLKASEGTFVSLNCSFFRVVVSMEVLLECVSLPFKEYDLVYYCISIS